MKSRDNYSRHIMLHGIIMAMEASLGSTQLADNQGHALACLWGLFARFGVEGVGRRVDFLAFSYQI
jgi:hypothetical protein